MRDHVRALRLAYNQQNGDARFDDPSIQESLLFDKAGNVIFDKAELNLAYFYPSAVGSALFFDGDFEAGEIAVATSVLLQVPSPVILDVGANIGVHTIAWARSVAGCVCHAFEPVPSNIDLLRQNVRGHNLDDRVRIEQCAVGSAEGKVLLHETDDAAYSSIVSTDRRPTVAEYEVDVTTIDAYVERNALQRLSLIKIDVEGYEDAVLAGAIQTLERFKPHLFVEISGENQNNDPEATIQRLQNCGYRAFVMNDGIVTPYQRHDDQFYNYLFVHESSDVLLPPPDPLQIRVAVARLHDLILRQRTGLTRANEEINKKEAEVRRMKAAADERLELIGRLDDTAKGAIAHAQTESGALHAEMLRLGQLAEGRLQTVELLRRENAEFANACERLQSELAVQQRMLEAAQAARGDEMVKAESLQKTVQEQADEMERLRHAATERLRIIEEFQLHVEYLRSQNPLDNAVEKDHQIAELSAELESRRTEITSQELLIAKLDSFLREQRAESDEMRRVAEERLGLIAELDQLATERLEVIRGLSEQLNRD